MKNLFFFCAAMLLITACGSDDPAPAPVEEATVEAPVAEVVETEAVAEAEEDAVLEVVE